MNYRIKNLKLKITKQGFTLIEMMIAVFVFMILFLIAASFVNLAVGSTKSNRTKLLTSDIRSVFDTINLKMNSANGVSIVNLNPRIYGFNGFNVNPTNTMLGIINLDGATNHCTFIGQVDSGIYMKVIDNCNGTWPTLAITDQKMTGPNINVTGFNVTMTPSNWNPSTQKIAPILKMIITAQDADPKYQNDNQIRLETSYTLNYQTVKRFEDCIARGDCP